MNTQTRADALAAYLRELYPDAAPHLTWQTPWQLMVAVMLAAQCTDARVNMVTPELFRRWPGPADIMDVPQEEVEGVIRSTGFFRSKARNLLASARMVVERFGGAVPRSMAELITLPGVARKTASCVLWGAFGINEGIAIDTHVGRVARRLGLTEHEDPVRVERDLMPLFPQAEWGLVNNRLVSFGRHVCEARKPRCPDCKLHDLCPKEGLK